MIAYLGIDPGITGAAALVYAGGFQIHDYAGPKAAAQTIDRWMWNYEIRLACLERIRIYPGRDGHHRSLKTINKLPGCAGEWRGILCAMGIEYQEVEPQVWQKILPIKRGLNSKARSIVAAKHFFPEAQEFLKLAKYHNRADALCLAKYAMILGG